MVLEKLVKFNGEAHVEITPAEYTQLTGRAGRRGIDVEGHAVVPVSYTHLDVYKRQGQKVGTQALVAVPASKILTESQLAKGMTLDDTVLFVLDVVSARPVLTKATGTAVPPKAGLPTVDVPDDPTKPATFTVPSPTPIKETLVQPLIVGTGPKVEKGQTIRVRYTGATWRTPDKPFDYSGKTPKTTAEFPIGVGQLIKAWDNTIPGQTVGSRLLVIVQPADGYGADGNPQADIKGDDVLIFVMDILDAWSD